MRCSSATHTLAATVAAAAPAADLSGQWPSTSPTSRRSDDARVAAAAAGREVEGTHQGDFVTRDLSGTIDGARVTLASRVTERTGDALNYRFTGELSGDTLSGALDLGEYRSATWTAKRVTPA